MQFMSKILVALVGLLHVGFAYVEMFAWETRGQSAFAGVLRPELFAETTVLAANQGLYNLFLAAGLFWACIIADTGWQKKIAVFFLCCVVVAGIFGFATTGLPNLILFQATPGIAALVAVLFTRGSEAVQARS